MQLLVYVSGNSKLVPPLMSGLLENGITGVVSVDCKGMIQSFEASDVDAPPIFGAMRHLINPEFQSGKIIFVVLPDEDIPVVKRVIHDICEKLRLPNTGVFFTVPVMNWEGDQL